MIRTDIPAFDMAALSQMASSGMLQPSSLVWKDGMKNWVEAKTVNELAALFDSSNGVPPIPNT